MIDFTRLLILLRPPRTPRACSLNLRSNRTDVPALSFVHNADIVRFIIASSGRNVPPTRVQPIPAEPPLHPSLAYPFLGFPVQALRSDNNELVQQVVEWRIDDADLALDPPDLDDDLLLAPVNGMAHAPMGGLIASILNAAATALSATLVAAANAASTTLMVAGVSISATLMVAMITVSATLMVAGIVISGTLIAAASSASAFLMAAANAASAFLMVAANAASAFLMAAANAASAFLMAAANATSATVMAAGNAVSATLMAAGNVLSGLLSSTRTTPLWLVAVVIGISLALSISDAAIYQFFWDFVLGALSSYFSQLVHQLFPPLSRSLPRGSSSGRVSVVFMYLRRVISESGTNIVERLPAYILTRIDLELTKFVIRFSICFGCISALVIMVLRLLSP